MSLIVSFPGTGQATIAEVGGKGHSLVRMAEAGLPIPPGAVLTTEFFAPWFDAIRASSTWMAFSDADPGAWSTLCEELKRLCWDLNLTASQQETLEELRRQLAMLGFDPEVAHQRNVEERQCAYRVLLQRWGWLR